MCNGGLKCYNSFVSKYSQITFTQISYSYETYDKGKIKMYVMAFRTQHPKILHVVIRTFS